MEENRYHIGFDKSPAASDKFAFRDDSSLVGYHPEYCYYDNCLLYEQENAQGISSETFDAQLRSSDFTSAKDDFGWMAVRVSTPCGHPKW